MPCPCRGRSAQLVLPEHGPGIVRMMFARFSGRRSGRHMEALRGFVGPPLSSTLGTSPASSIFSAESKEHQPRRVSLKPPPELLRCRAGMLPDEQRDGSLPVKLVAVAEASGQRKTRWLWQAQRVSPFRVKFASRMPVRTCGASAKRGRLASPISSRAKFFRRGAARRGDGTPRRRGTWPM